MTQTDIANLALDLLGEPYLTSYDSDTGTTAEAVRLHYPVALKSLLESHPWSFATACSQLTAAPLDETYASITLNPTGDNNDILFTAVQAGPSGNEITVALIDDFSADDIVSVDANAISIKFANRTLTVVIDLGSGAVSHTLIPAGEVEGKPAWSVSGLLTTPPGSGACKAYYSAANGGYVIYKLGSGLYSYRWMNESATVDGDTYTADPAGLAPSSTAVLTGHDSTAQDVIDAITASTSASLLVTAANGTGSTGAGTVAAVSATNLAGGTSTSSVYAPAYGSAFNLPDDCVRLLKIDDVDIDAPRMDFEIQGRHLLLEETNAEAPVIHYIAADPAISDWPSTFTDAFVTLLAHRLSAKLCQNDNLKQSLRNDHQLALASAKNKDARETRSRENHGPRQLAARSGLVNARFTRTAQPPYSAT